jgi:hypothetical protein
VETENSAVHGEDTDFEQVDLNNVVSDIGLVDEGKISTNREGFRGAQK